MYNCTLFAKVVLLGNVVNAEWEHCIQNTEGRRRKEKLKDKIYNSTQLDWHSALNFVLSC